MTATGRGLASRYRALPVPARAALWFTICGVLQRAVSAVTMPLFTRLMSPADYGLYTLYNSWFQVLAVVVTLRLNYAVFNKGLSKYSDDCESYTATMQTMTSILGAALLVMYLIAQGWVNSVTGLSTTVTVAMFVEVATMSMASFWIARQRYAHRYRHVVFVTLTTVLGNAFLGVLAVMLSEDKGTARILSGVAVQAALGIALYVRSARQAPRIFVAEFARFAVLFNLPLIPHYLSMYALDSLDRIMVARMVGLESAGLYGVAYSVGLLMKIAADSISSSVVPWQYQRLAVGELHRVESTWFPLLSMTAVVSAAFGCLGPEVIALVGGQRYAGAAGVIPVVAGSIPFILAYNLFANVELHYDENRFMMFASVFAAIANAGLNWLLIPRFGFLAAAYTTLACYGMLAVSHFLFMRHLVHRRTGLIVAHTARYFLLVLAVVVVAVLTGVMSGSTYARYGMLLVLLSGVLYGRKWFAGVFSQVRRNQRGEAAAGGR